VNDEEEAEHCPETDYFPQQPISYFSMAKNI
jgi:hypothetical protein